MARMFWPWGSPTKMQRHQEERLTAVEPENVVTEALYPALRGWEEKFTGKISPHRRESGDFNPDSQSPPRKNKTPGEIAVSEAVFGEKKFR